MSKKKRPHHSSKCRTRAFIIGKMVESAARLSLGRAAPMVALEPNISKRGSAVAYNLAIPMRGMTELVALFVTDVVDFSAFLIRFFQR